ncbi:MAG: hypothetical protein IJ606_04140 [Bacteroidaceae bacterium]|nr:hypothetical protein [Bacteroidaceae bacterium]
MRKVVFSLLFIIAPSLCNAQWTYYEPVNESNTFQRQTAPSISNTQLVRGYYYSGGWRQVKLKLAEVESYLSGGRPKLAIVAYYNRLLSDWTTCRIVLQPLSRMVDSRELCETFTYKCEIPDYGTIYI